MEGKEQLACFLPSIQLINQAWAGLGTHSIGLPHIWILICCKIYIYIYSENSTTGQNVGAQQNIFLANGQNILEKSQKK